jgi:hypothetical protein
VYAVYANDSKGLKWEIDGVEWEYLPEDEEK